MGLAKYNKVGYCTKKTTSVRCQSKAWVTTPNAPKRRPAARGVFMATPKQPPYHVDTLAIHAGRTIDPGTRAISPPLITSTTFERGQHGDYPAGWVYGREGNPNRNSFEAAVAALEGGAEALAFASGMAAITAVLESLPHSTGNILLPYDHYAGIRALITETDIGKRFRFVYVEDNNAQSYKKSLQNEKTALVWIETPSNPLLDITSLAETIAAAHAVGALAFVDNTWATPILQQPLSYGADGVVHSATKYLGGHSDLTAGVVVLPPDSPLHTRLRAHQHHKGGIAAPFDCWLALRGIQTLPIRMRTHCENATNVARALAQHPAVTQVRYPGLESHPGHTIAAQQMRGFGGMLSFEVKGGAPAALAVTQRLRLVTRATSLGGTHSLIEHRASVEGPATRAPPGLLRMSVGLEHPNDIIDDLMTALADQ